jgi:hypothetical protein
MDAHRGKICVHSYQHAESCKLCGTPLSPTSVFTTVGDNSEGGDDNDTMDGGMLCHLVCCRLGACT